MTTGKGCYKWRSSSLLHIHMFTSTFTHTQTDAHTRTHSGLYAAGSNQSMHWAQRGGITTQLLGFIRKFCSISEDQGWKRPQEVTPSIPCPWQRPASAILLLRCIFITSPWRHPVQEMAELVSAVARVCCCLGATYMLCEHPGVHATSCWTWSSWAQSSANRMAVTDLSLQSNREHI